MVDGTSWLLGNTSTVVQETKQTNIANLGGVTTSKTNMARDDRQIGRRLLKVN